MPNNSGDNRLTDKQEKFVQELIKGKTQREAYRIAYPNSKAKDKTVDETASRLMSNNKVNARFKELHDKVRAKSEKATIASALDVLEEIANIAFGRKKYPTHDMFGNEFEKQTTVNERLKALDLMGKHYRLFTENINVNHSGVIINDNIPGDADA